MVISEHNIFGCPVCGFRVGQGSDSCPRCGNEFSESTKFECPFCGELVDQGVDECPSCHVDYSDFRAKTEARGGDDSVDALLEELIELEASSVKKEDRRLSCPKCAWLLDGSENACPKCGMKFSEEVSFHCPICGTPVASESANCQECGADFASQEAAGQERDGFKKLERVESKLDDIVTAASLLRASEPEPQPPEEPELETRTREAEPVQEPEAMTPAPEEHAEVQREEAFGETKKEQGAGLDGVLEDLESMSVKPAKAPPKKKSRQRKLKAKSSSKKKV